MGIYKITNTLNGKVYIGQSIDIEHRWYNEKKMHGINKYLKNAFIKNGVENFSFEILEECSVDELNDKEKSYILKYNSFDRNFGYNQTTGGDCNYRQKSFKMSEETRRKISASRIGIKFSDEHKKKLSEARQKRVISEETKTKQSNSLKNIYKNETLEHKEKRIKNISNAKKGKKLSDEHKKKLSDAAKNRKKPTKGRKVLCVDTGKIYNTINEAKIETGAKKISDVCNGKRKTSNKLKFVYVEK